MIFDKVSLAWKILVLFKNISAPVSDLTWLLMRDINAWRQLSCEIGSNRSVRRTLLCSSITRAWL